MKTIFKNAILIVFSFIVLATCTNPFAPDLEEKATFTIIIGTNSAKANNSRAVYPPDTSEIANLKFIVKFTPLTGGTAETFTATGNKEFTGNVKTGHYKVTMEIYTVSDNLIYARGVANENPVEIKATGNFIHVDAYNATNAYPPVIKVKPKDAAYHVNFATPDDLTVEAETEDNGTLTYQWYSNGATNSNSGGTAISGATSASYTPSTATAGNFYYYVGITNNQGTPTSIFTKPAHIYVGDNAETPDIKTQPIGSPAEGIAKNSTFTLIVNAEVADHGILTYQWYSNGATNSNSGGTAISGATSTSYHAPTATEGTIYYYVIITNTNNTAPGQKTATTTSNAVAVKVNASVNASTPTISGTLSDATYNQNATATALTVTATHTGSGTLSYQWYRNESNSNTGGTAVGTNSNSYTPDTSSIGDLYYYCVVSNTIANNGDGGTKTATATSNVAKVTVNAIITYTASPNNSTDTTAIDFTFSSAVTGLTASNITINNGTGTVIKGTLTGSSTSWSLAITVNTAGNVSVSINKSGIESGTKTVEVAKSVSSTVGINWTAVTSIPFNDTIFAIAYGGTSGQEKFVIGGGNGKMAYSTNGTTWTAITSSPFTESIYAIAYGNGLFVAGDYSGKMAYSTNGTTWTTVTDSPFGNNSIGPSALNAIAYGNGVFVAGGGDAKMAYSINGETWTNVTDSTFSSGTYGISDVYAITYGNGVFVAVGDKGKIAYSTDDGKNWTAIPVGITNWTTGTFASTDRIRSTAYGGSSFVAACVNHIAYSENNGLNWNGASNTLVGNIFNGEIWSIAYGNGKFVAGGIGKMAYSINGETWTAINVNSIFESYYGIRAIAYGNGKFVAGGEGGKIAVSE